MANVLPAHETKHLDLLSYHYFGHTFDLTQVSDGQSNGTALWLGAQCMSVFLVDALPSRKLSPPKPISTPRLQTVDYFILPLWTWARVDSNFLHFIFALFLCHGLLSKGQATSPASSKFMQQSLSAHRPRAIELGSGIGLTAYVLSSAGLRSRQILKHLSRRLPSCSTRISTRVRHL